MVGARRHYSGTDVKRSEVFPNDCYHVIGFIILAGVAISIPRLEPKCLAKQKVVRRHALGLPEQLSRLRARPPPPLALDGRIAGPHPERANYSTTDDAFQEVLFLLRGDCDQMPW